MILDECGVCTYGAWVILVSIVGQRCSWSLRGSESSLPTVLLDDDYAFPTFLSDSSQSTLSVLLVKRTSIVQGDEGLQRCRHGLRRCVRPFSFRSAALERTLDPC
jgi:hypothetical protein